MKRDEHVSECKEKAVSEVMMGSSHRSEQNYKLQNSWRELLTETCMDRGSGLKKDVWSGWGKRRTQSEGESG